MRNYLHGVLLAALVATGGGYSAVLQAIAWGTMIVRYSQDSCLAEGVERTFSGKEPCQLCKRVTEIESRKSEQLPKETIVPLRSFDLFPTEQAELPMPVEGLQCYYPAKRLGDSPPVLELLLPPPEQA